jgi:hypothetical protein
MRSLVPSTRNKAGTRPRESVEHEKIPARVAAVQGFDCRASGAQLSLRAMNAHLRITSRH